MCERPRALTHAIFVSSRTRREKRGGEDTRKLLSASYLGKTNSEAPFQYVCISAAVATSTLFYIYIRIYRETIYLIGVCPFVFNKKKISQPVYLKKLKQKTNDSPPLYSAQELAFIRLPFVLLLLLLVYKYRRLKLKTCDE